MASPRISPRRTRSLVSQKSSGILAEQQQQPLQYLQGGPIFFQGFVEKTAKYTKSWVSRHLRLEEDEVSYAADDNAQVKSTIKLVKIERFAESAPIVPSDLKDYYGMLLFGSNDEKWVVRCGSESVYEEWYARFKTVLYRKGLGDPYNFGLPKYDDRTGLPFAKVPLKELKTFIRLENSVIYHFSRAVFELTLLTSRPSEVVVIIGDSAIYLCDMEGFIIRCIIFSQLMGALWATRRGGGMLVGLPTSPKPGEPDLIIRFETMDKGKEFLRVLTVVHDFTVAAWAAMEEEEREGEVDVVDQNGSDTSGFSDDDLNLLISKKKPTEESRKKKKVTITAVNTQLPPRFTSKGLQVDQVTEPELLESLEPTPPFGYNLKIVLPTTKEQLATSLGMNPRITEAKLDTASLSRPSPTTSGGGTPTTGRAQSTGRIGRLGSIGAVGSRVKTEDHQGGGNQSPAAVKSPAQSRPVTSPAQARPSTGYIFPHNTGQTTSPSTHGNGVSPNVSRQASGLATPPGEKMGHIFPKVTSVGSNLMNITPPAGNIGMPGGWADQLAHNVVSGEKRAKYAHHDDLEQPVDDMKAFLTRVGLAIQYEEHFMEQGVDYDVLVTARPAELMMFGVKNSHHRSRIMKEAVRLAEESKTFPNETGYSYVLADPLLTLQSPPPSVATHLPPRTRTSTRSRFGSGGSLPPVSSLPGNLVSPPVGPVKNDSEFSFTVPGSPPALVKTPKGVPSRFHLLSPDSSSDGLKMSFSQRPSDEPESFLSMSFAAGGSQLMTAQRLAMAAAQAAETGEGSGGGGGTGVAVEGDNDLGLLDLQLSTVSIDSL